MNKRTKILLAVCGLLALITATMFLFRMSRTQDSLHIQGLGTRISTVDSISVSIGGRSVELSRGPSGKWTFSPPKGAVADQAQVVAVLGLFETDIMSVIPSDVGADPAAFGLAPDSAVEVRLAVGGQEVAVLEIGAVQKTADAGPDTFVRVPGSRTVFRVTDRDLRAPFSGGLAGLRSKLLFDADARSVEAVDFFNPLAQDLEARLVRVAFEGDRNSALAPTMWKIVQPQGWNPGRIPQAIGQILAIQVDRWADELPPDVVISESSPGIRLELENGRIITARLSEESQDHFWVAVDGIDGAGRLVSRDAALMKRTVQELADMTLIAMPPERIASITVTGPSGSLSVERHGHGFRLLGPAAFALDRTTVESWLAALLAIRATRTGPRPDAAAGVEPQAEFSVQVTDSTGAVTGVSLGPTDGDGFRTAFVAGRPVAYLVAESSIAPLKFTAGDLRVRAVCDIPASSVGAITLKSPVFGTAVLMPPGQDASLWSVRFDDGSTTSSKEVTTLAGAAMSMLAARFIDRPRPGQVRSETLEIIYRGGDSAVTVRISSETIDGMYVAAASGNRGMARQAFLLPAQLVDSLAGVYNFR